ncbi:hypothetical protein [Halorussus aquaticus]|uniref:Uncharacterized protein n=1 Tax=Halorussus aquaticus TaxID=2953748 RepID=A0ABD5PZG5_9EURY|nr:hypothetical protein [Halorussus aquaticus]
MTNERVRERPARRRVNRVRELERRIERLEAEVRWLRRAVVATGKRTGAMPVGPCPDCGRGVLLRRESELVCSACEYCRYL